MAACHPTPDARVGALAKINDFTAKLIPAVADKLAVSEMGRQHIDVPSRTPEGGLWRELGR